MQKGPHPNLEQAPKTALYPPRPVPDPARRRASFQKCRSLPEMVRTVFAMLDGYMFINSSKKIHAPVKLPESKHQHSEYFPVSPGSTHKIDHFTRLAAAAAAARSDRPLMLL